MSRDGCETHDYKRTTSGISKGKYTEGAIQYRTCKDCNNRQVLLSTGWKDINKVETQ
jgi:hypothetical protein